MKNFLNIVPTVYFFVTDVHGDACFAVGSSLPEICDRPFSRRTYVEDRQNNSWQNNTASRSVFFATDSRD